MAAEDAVRVGLRDIDTSVNFSSVYLAVLYARAVYEPADLPTEDAVLLDVDDDIEVVFTGFNDTGTGSLPGDPADQSIALVVGETVYRVTRPDDDDHEGFLYITDVVSGSRPFGAEVQLTIDTVIPGGGYGSFPYVPWTDFTGVMIGFVYWPRSTGVFLFLRDDGVDKSISITGPATDTSGARTSLADVVFDWSADAYTYRVTWDETQGRSLVSLFAISSDGLTETLLHEESVSALDPFLANVTIGNDDEEDPPARIGVLVGTDGPGGDSIDVYKVALYAFGGATVMSGLEVGGAEASVASSDSTLIEGTEDATTWAEEGTGTVDFTGAGINIVRTDDDVDDEMVLRRDEPDLARREWVLLAKFHAQDVDHPGTYAGGMGIQVEDGTSSVALRVYDDFTAHDLGVLHGTGDVAGDYTFPTTAVEWEDDVVVVVHASGSRDTVRTWITGDETPEISETYNALDYPSTTDAKVSVGILDATARGTFTLDYLWVLPVVDAYEVLDGTYPEAQGWVRTNSGGTRSIATTMNVDCTVVGDYDSYSMASADYATTAGVTLYFKTQVMAWTDETGAVNPSRRAIGPVAYAPGPSGGAQVCFAVADSGKSYVYIPGEDEEQALSDVLVQNSAGRAISAEVAVTEAHAYILVVRPGAYIRLHVDYDVSPAIEVAWDDTNGFSLASTPGTVPAGSHAAFGSLGADSGVSMATWFARASLGRGYDVSARLVLTDAELEEHVQASVALIFADFEDT